MSWRGRVCTPHAPQEYIGQPRALDIFHHVLEYLLSPGSQACVFDATETGDFAMLPAAVEAFLQECIDVYALVLLLVSCVCALIFSESCHVVQFGL